MCFAGKWFVFEEEFVLVQEIVKEYETGEGK
jgi:hypothetical protein